jgi:aminodeoxyfutalosine synthase
MQSVIEKISAPPELRSLYDKIMSGGRINDEECLLLYSKADLAVLGVLANRVNHIKNKDKVCFIRNFHIEPTNICIYHCKFCSYSQRVSDVSWDHSPEEMISMLKDVDEKINEVHITGGVHPNHDIHYYGKLLQKIKEIRTSIHVKAYSAIEIDYMIKKAGLSFRDGLQILKDYGLDSIPGGGAEIFDEKIRSEICDDKTSSSDWLEIHETAHTIGISSNATILYGHIESYEHRIDHMKRLRDIQDRTNGFNSFIPLKFKNKHNEMSDIDEATSIEDMKNYAVSRIFLDNFPHIKAYWPMIGKEMTQLSLSFGVDDVDGTIEDSTKIYSLAGAEEQNPSMSADDFINMVKQANKIPVERDSNYNIIKTYS